MLPNLENRPIFEARLRMPCLAVGLGEARALKAGNTDGAADALVAFGLGSCVALCLWDGDAAVAGMAHIVLPGEDPRRKPNPKFARSVLPALLARMRAQGGAAHPRRLVARLAGGALVLTMDSIDGIARVGDANADAVLEVLSKAGIAIGATDLGGTLGRTVWFDPREHGHIRVRSIGCSTDRYL